MQHSNFEATSPERILDYFDEEKLKIDEKKKRIENALPLLKEEIQTKPTAEAYILSGAEGFKVMRRDLFRSHPEELLILGGIAREDKVMPIFYRKWTAERVKKNIPMKVLHKEEARGKIPSPSKYLTRYLPPEISNPAVINIYGDRVVNVLWKGDYPLCFVMVNKDNADAYRKYFDLLWKVSGKA